METNPTTAALTSQYSRYYRLGTRQNARIPFFGSMVKQYRKENANDNHFSSSKIQTTSAEAGLMRIGSMVRKLLRHCVNKKERYVLWRVYKIGEDPNTKLASMSVAAA